MHPKPSAETSGPFLPNMRFCICFSFFKYRAKGPGVREPAIDYDALTAFPSSTGISSASFKQKFSRKSSLTRP
jgi:hypothetical protein